MIPVNLSVDSMLATSPARTADLIAAIADHPYVYADAVKKIGMTPREYAEFRASLVDGGAIYVVLPRHIDAMAGKRRFGSVYALHNVVVPSRTMGWAVPLKDGVTVFVPRACGNLSMSRPRSMRRAVALTQSRVHNTDFRGYYPPTPVTFTPEINAPAVEFDTAPLPYYPAAVSAPHGLSLGWIVPLIPAIGSLFGGSGPHQSTALGTEVAPCYLGSNLAGVCRR